MKLKFTKMQGAGNDFVVIDGFTRPIQLSAQQIQAMANRYFGIGFDQLLMVEKTETPDVDFRYRIFNADGGEVQQCGNGARCFVKYVVEKGLTEKQAIRVETASGIISLTLQADGQVTVNMGKPNFDPKMIPFDATAPALLYPLQLLEQVVEIAAVSMGNPHAVTRVNHIEEVPVDKLGPQIEAHSRFPEHVNAGFMEIVDPHHLKLRVYERGSGETLACGTGACAAVVSGIRLGELISPVEVTTRGGTLTIAWAGNDSPVLMTGPAEIVFEGEIEI